MNSATRKNIRRLARLELRGDRITALSARAAEAKNTALVATYAKETKRRAAESAYLATRVEADLEDHPEWAAEATAIREATMLGSRGSVELKKLMAGPAPAPATAAAE
jgi:hypothetical protein